MNQLINQCIYWHWITSTCGKVCLLYCSSTKLSCKV